jgi:hypothetical protein
MLGIRVDLFTINKEQVEREFISLQYSNTGWTVLHRERLTSYGYYSLNQSLNLPEIGLESEKAL